MRSTSAEARKPAAAAVVVSQDDDLARRAAKAEAVQIGELSSARQALEGAPVAPGNRATLCALGDPVKRPTEPRDQIPPEVSEFQLASPLEFDIDGFARNIRSAQRGAAGGPSGVTAEHIRPILESECVTAAMGRMATDLHHPRRVEDESFGCSPEAWRWRQRHRHWRHLPQNRCPQHRPATQVRSRRCHVPFEVRVIHQSWWRVRCSSGSDPH